MSLFVRTSLSLIGLTFLVASCTTEDTTTRSTAVDGIAALEGRFPVLRTIGAAPQRDVMVALPATGDGAVHFADAKSGVAVDITLDGAEPIAPRESGNRTLYGDHLFVRLDRDGFEDFVVFNQRPAAERITYTLDVSHVAGVRLVANTLELLDDGGAPRLRVSPPAVIDGSGRHPASLALDGCAVDTDPRPPWGRAFARPGSSCTLRIAWAHVGYPLLVDPHWNATGSMSTIRVGHTGTLLASGKALMTGGSDSVNGLASAELYDPSTGTFAMTGTMSVARAGHTATLLPTGKVLVTGGGTNAAELYDPVAGTFAATGSMPNPESGHTATLLASGKVLVVGSAAYLYNQGAFVPTAGALGNPRSTHAAVTLANGKVLVAGGTTTEPTAELYDPTTNKFAATPPMVWFNRIDLTATLLKSGKVLVVGSRPGQSDGVPEIYDPVTNSFTATKPLLVYRSAHNAAALASGSVVIIGGINGDVAQIRTVELYDPVSGNFGLGVPPISVGRANLPMVELSPGRFLLAGGRAFNLSQYAYYASAEVLSIAPLGASCSASTDCEANAPCVDGVCCESTCQGQCSACNVKDSLGKCVPIQGAPVGGRLACAGAGQSCGGTCDGKSGAACSYPSSTTACASSCDQGRLVESACGGSGSCVAGTTHECEGHYACADKQSCRTMCTVDVDCVPGFHCNEGKCTDTAACIADNISKSGSGELQVCTPYRCDGKTGTCRVACGSVDECIAPNACDPTGHCVPVATDNGSCAIGSGSGGAGFALVLGAFAVVGLGRRRRRRAE